MPTATVTSKGQITIPIEVRKAFNLKAGDRLDFFQTKFGDYFVQPNTGSIMDMEGILKKLGYVPDGFTVSIEEMNEAVLDHAAELDRMSMSDYIESNPHGKKA
jgi:antitoxin PrlF